MSAVFDFLDQASGLDYIVAAIVAGAGLIWIAQVLAEASAHRRWAQRKRNFPADHSNRERVGIPLAGSTETQTPHISPPLGHSRQDIFNADHPGRVRLGLNERARRR